MKNNPKAIPITILAINCFLLLSSFDGGIPAGNAALEKKLMKSWKQLGYPEGVGGVPLLIITPEGEYFASTIPEVTQGTHFRAASITKLTAAAAFMPLEQRGLVKLDDPVTAPLPGRTDSFLPDGGERNIPWKEKITPRLLPQH